MSGAPGRALDRFFAGLSRLLVGIACLFMVLMALHVAADISARLLWRQSLDGTTAVVSSYYMVGLIFLPLLACRRERALLVVELLARFYGPRLNRFLDALGDLLMAAWFLLFTWVTAHMALDKTASREFVETSVSVMAIWPGRWFLPIGTGATALYCLVQGVRVLCGRAPLTEPATNPEETP